MSRGKILEFRSVVLRSRYERWGVVWRSQDPSLGALLRCSKMLFLRQQQRKIVDDSKSANELPSII
jgi:hypothetical protein